MRIELVDCENMLLREIACPEMRQRDVAQTYALALRSSRDEKVDWAKVNAAIVERWSVSGLERIKAQAWSGKCFEKKSAAEAPEVGR